MFVHRWPLREEVEMAMSRLHPIERQILDLASRRGLPNAEIAERPGMPKRSAGRIPARALRKVDRAMEHEHRPWHFR